MSGLRRLTCGAIVLGLLSGGNRSSHPFARETRAAQTTDVAFLIRSILETVRGSPSGARTVAEQQQLTALYGSESYLPLWVDGSGRVSRDAREALALLQGATTEGLDPHDYDAGTLHDFAARPGGADIPGVADIARFDVALSVNTLRYFQQLHFGRVDPGAVGFRMPPREREDLVERLRAALAGHSIAFAAAELTPSIALYRRLRSALSRYRTLETDPALRLFQPPQTTVHPGERCDELPQLHRLLIALGDLPAGDPDSVESLTYEGRPVDGVKHFQFRHGLEPDGVLGKSTRTALNVPLAWRVRQIELALERLRWLPHLDPDRFLAVNIPMFRVWGLESVAQGTAPSFGTEVIVGRALDTQTPVFVEEMEYVIFRPYWNVPSSILRHEILPAVSRTPDYLQRHSMEIVSGQSDDAPILPVTAANLERLRHGTLRVRQRPGPNNSLGLVKFVFPNDVNVYMHGTPVPELFSRARRDFRHGCIRVADPVGLAEWVLAAQPNWTQDRILMAMNAKASMRVNLTRPIQVILFYLTAVVMPEDGTVHFAEDIYGHDARLDHYLTRRRVS
jgi:murein L,D-transpeptidase YcbB/YkuD